MREIVLVVLKGSESMPVFFRGGGCGNGGGKLKRIKKII
jgi:hypothetical protein